MKNMYGGTPSPNPDYPQEVKVVTGENTINVVGKNLFDKDSPNIINAYLNNDGTTSLNSTFRVSDYINVNNLGEITISGNNGNSELCCFYDRSKTFISSFGMGTLTTRTVSVPNNAKYLRVTLNSSVLSQYQIEVGSTASTYKSFQSQSYPIKLSDKNLFDKYHLIGGWISTTGVIFDQYQDTYNYTDYIAVKPNTTYRLDLYNAAGLSSGGVCEYSSKSASSFITGIAESQALIVFKTTSTTNYVRFTVRVNAKDQITLTEGETLLDTQIELAKIGDYKDKIYKSNEKWYLHKEIASVVLTGANTESWGLYTTGVRRFGLNDTTRFFEDSLPLKCDYFTCGIKATSTTPDLEMWTQTSYLGITDINSNWSSVGVLRAWLGTHNITVYYPLATSTNTEITDETLINQLEAIHLATGTNVIEFSGDTLVSGMDINYIGEASSHL